MVCISPPPPASYSMGTVVLVLRVKRPRAYLDHSPSFRAELKNDRSYISVSPLSHNGVDETKFTFTFICVCPNWITQDYVTLGFNIASVELLILKCLFSVIPVCISKLARFQTFAGFLYVAYFLLGNSPASECYMPTFRNTLSVPSS